jgi:hypothetical protein
MLKAAVRMACDDVTSPGWISIWEQIDGGDFSQPRKLHGREDVLNFLLEYDVAMSKPSSKRKLESAISYEKLRSAPISIKQEDAVIVNLAQFSNYTSLLEGCVGDLLVETQSAQTIELIRIAWKEMRPKLNTPSSSGTTYFTPAANAPTTSGTSASTSSTQSALRKDQELPRDLARVGYTYRTAGCNITARLVAFLESKMGSWSDFEKSQIKALYRKAVPPELGVCRWESCSSFEKFAHQARKSCWKMDDEVADWFIAAITGRRKLRDWHDHLPSGDNRFDANDRHEAWLQTLINVVFALAGHQLN